MSLEWPDFQNRQSFWILYSPPPGPQWAKLGCRLAV